jgi:hypothetical protein
MASYSCEVRGEDGSSRGMGSDVTAHAGSNRLEIKNGRLTANGKSYGTLNDGDFVLLDRDGTVSINGKTRAAE